MSALEATVSSQSAAVSVDLTMRLGRVEARPSLARRGRELRDELLHLCCVLHLQLLHLQLRLLLCLLHDGGKLGGVHGERRGAESGGRVARVACVRLAAMHPRESASRGVC